MTDVQGNVGGSGSRQHLVEVALGWRIVRNGSSGWSAIGLRATRRATEGAEPKPVVRPATALEAQMWAMLVAGEGEWGADTAGVEGAGLGAGVIVCEALGGGPDAER